MIDLLLTLADSPFALVPPEPRPPIVNTAIEAVAAKDAARIAPSFSRLRAFA